MKSLVFSFIAFSVSATTVPVDNPDHYRVAQIVASNQESSVNQRQISKDWRDGYNDSSKQDSVLLMKEFNRLDATKGCSELAQKLHRWANFGFEPVTKFSERYGDLLEHCLPQLIPLCSRLNKSIDDVTVSKMAFSVNFDDMEKSVPSIFARFAEICPISLTVNFDFQRNPSHTSWGSLWKYIEIMEISKPDDCGFFYHSHPETPSLPNIKHLQFNTNPSTESCLKIINAIGEKVEKFVLSFDEQVSREGSSFSSFLARQKNLKKLNVAHADFLLFYDDLPETLSEIRLSNVNYSAAIGNFLKRQRSLRRLSISHIDLSIGDQLVLPQPLEGLTINNCIFSHHQTVFFQSLKSSSLKYLNLELPVNVESETETTLIINAIPTTVETLTLMAFINEESAYLISHLPQLTDIGFYSCKTRVASFKTIIDALPPKAKVFVSDRGNEFFLDPNSMVPYNNEKGLSIYVLGESEVKRFFNIN